jgi:hypothetical protein
MNGRHVRIARCGPYRTRLTGQLAVDFLAMIVGRGGMARLRRRALMTAICDVVYEKIDIVYFTYHVFWSVIRGTGRRKPAR